MQGNDARAVNERIEAGLPTCGHCDGDGYTETWNDDQSGVVTELCQPCAGTGFEHAGFDL